MESVFFVMAYTAGFLNGTGKKMRSIFSKPYSFLVSFLPHHSKNKDVEDVQELTEEEYNRRFGKFFPKASKTGELVMLGSNSMSTYDWNKAQSVSHLSDYYSRFGDTEDRWHHDRALARVYESIDQCSNPLRTDNPFTGGFIDNSFSNSSLSSYQSSHQNSISSF